MIVDATDRVIGTFTALWEYRVKLALLEVLALCAEPNERRILRVIPRRILAGVNVVRSGSGRDAVRAVNAEYVGADRKHQRVLRCFAGQFKPLGRTRLER